MSMHGTLTDSVAYRNHHSHNYTLPMHSRPSRAWLFTFTDLVLLMLTFFVMLFAMGTPDAGKWDEMTSPFRQPSGDLTPLQQNSASASEGSVDAYGQLYGMNLGYLAVRYEQEFHNRPEWQQVSITRLSDRLVISLPSALLFDSASAEISPEGEAMVRDLARLLQFIDNRLETHGHSDPIPLRQAGHEANWALSLRRAIVVSDIMRDAGYRRPIRAHGHGDSLFGAIPDDFGREVRFDLARRVDIVIMAER